MYFQCIYIYVFFYKIIFRYMSQKRYDEALETVHNGACLFLKQRQVLSLGSVGEGNRVHPSIKS